MGRVLDLVELIVYSSGRCSVVKKVFSETLGELLITTFRPMHRPGNIFLEYLATHLIKYWPNSSPKAPIEGSLTLEPILTLMFKSLAKVELTMVFQDPSIRMGNSIRNQHQ